ncbi:MAG: hypothetical protein B6U73_01295 [Desulfurococcales archaeon ex4484_204]|nr:MAG: hypothetical protein B6U73_01295 [Desulfurococcales archaeon ex4484_204]
MYRYINKAVSKTLAVIIAVVVIIAVIAGVATYLATRPPAPSPSVTTTPATSPTAAPATPTPSPKAPKELKVAVILPGTVTDYGWDYAPVIALNKLEAMSLPIPIVSHKYVELVEPAEAEGVMRSLIAAGYNWIWAWGFQYREAVLKVAKTAPEGVYFTINEGKPEDVIPGKVEIIDEWPHKTAYLAGIIAASVSKTKKLGGIDGMETLHLKLAEAGFVAGAKAYDPNIKYYRVIVGGWGDPEGGKRAAESLMAMGVDVIFCQGDGTSLGVIEAVKKARDEGKEVYYIGYPVDQSVIAPGYVLTSLNYDYSDILKQQVYDMYYGRFGNGKYSIELGRGMELAPFYNFDPEIPERAKKMVREAREKILKGELVVPTELEKVLGK